MERIQQIVANFIREKAPVNGGLLLLGDREDGEGEPRWLDHFLERMSPVGAGLAVRRDREIYRQMREENDRKIEEFEAHLERTFVER